MVHRSARIGVVIPTYKPGEAILGVIARMVPEVTRIYVVDDRCPQQTGQMVREKCIDPRVHVIFHEQNQGVGGALITGYGAAIADDMEIIVKIDSDGQMDPQIIPSFVAPIVDGIADYTKGNRFFDVASLEGMPFVRVFGNAMLSDRCVAVGRVEVRPVTGREF